LAAARHGKKSIGVKKGPQQKNLVNAGRTSARAEATL
jgi:hypothetical protein